MKSSGKDGDEESMGVKAGRHGSHDVDDIQINPGHIMVVSLLPLELQSDSISLN